MEKHALVKIVGAAALIRDKRVLLTRRSERMENYSNCWILSAGHLNESDLSIEECVRREVQEEIGLIFEPVKKFDIYECWTKRIRSFVVVFLGGSAGSVIPQESEVSQWAYFSYYEALNVRLAYMYDTVLLDFVSAGLIT